MNIKVKDVKAKIKEGWGYTQFLLRLNVKKGDLEIVIMSQNKRAREDLMKMLKANEAKYLDSLKVAEPIKPVDERQLKIANLRKEEAKLSEKIMKVEKAYQDKRTEKIKKVAALEKVAKETRKLVEQASVKMGEYQALAKENDDLVNEMRALYAQMSAGHNDLDKIREDIANLTRVITVHVAGDPNDFKFTDDEGNLLNEPNLGKIKEELFETGQFENQSYKVLYYSAIIESIKRNKNCRYEDLKFVGEEGTDISIIGCITDALSKINFIT